MTKLTLICNAGVRGGGGIKTDESGQKGWGYKKILQTSSMDNLSILNTLHLKCTLRNQVFILNVSVYNNNVRNNTLIKSKFT